MYSVEVSPRAEYVIFKTVEFYNNRRKGQGKKFLKEVISFFDTIAQNPDAFELKDENIRVAPMKNHSHLIFYFYRKDAKTVYILAVLHSSQNPDNWPVEIPPVR